MNGREVVDAFDELERRRRKEAAALREWLVRVTSDQGGSISSQPEGVAHHAYMGPLLLDFGDVSDALGVSVPTVKRLVRAGALPAVKVAGATVHDGQRAPGLRFGEPRTIALFGSIAAFAHVIDGLTNKSLRDQMTVLWPPDYTSAQASYDLRRRRLKGLIDRSRARTPTASRRLRIAAFSTQLAARDIVPALTDLAAPPGPV